MFRDHSVDVPGEEVGTQAPMSLSRSSLTTAGVVAVLLREQRREVKVRGRPERHRAGVRRRQTRDEPRVRGSRTRGLLEMSSAVH